jgi:hypothetical protein
MLFLTICDKQTIKNEHWTHTTYCTAYGLIHESKKQCSPFFNLISSPLVGIEKRNKIRELHVYKKNDEFALLNFFLRIRSRSLG